MSTTTVKDPYLWAIYDRRLIESTHLFKLDMTLVEAFIHTVGRMEWLTAHRNAP